MHVSDRSEAQRFDLTLPAAQHDRLIQGSVFWPTGDPAKGVHIFLEDRRWAWRALFAIAAMTDEQGHFTTYALDGTRYRLHAIGSTNGVAAGPVEIAPGASPLDLKLILLMKNDSRRDSMGKGLDDWRKGLGLR